MYTVFGNGEPKVEFYYLVSIANEAKRYYFPSAEFCLILKIWKMQRGILNSSLKKQKSRDCYHFRFIGNSKLLRLKQKYSSNI